MLHSVRSQVLTDHAISRPTAVSTLYKNKTVISPEIMAPIDCVVPQQSTSPSSPHLQAREQVHTLNSGQFQELLKAIQAVQTVQTPGANMLVSTDNIPSDNTQPAARASKMEFKEVSEM